MKKLFTNDKFFLATVLAAIFGTLFCDAVNWAFNTGAEGIIAVDMLAVLCILVLYTSYKKHSKNVMKCVIGALLMLILLQPISGLTEFTGMSAVSIVLSFQTVFAAGLFITHNIINSDHHSNARYIRFNQILCVLIFVCKLVVGFLFMRVDETALIKVADLFCAIGYACVAATIVCVESRLDAYRLDREAAGWTEEAGYPEGYVHEYEKE